MSDKIRAYFRPSMNWKQIKDEKKDYASAKVEALGGKFKSVEISVGAAKYQRRGAKYKFVCSINAIARYFLGVKHLFQRFRGLGPDETSYGKSRQRRADRKAQREHDKLIGKILKDHCEKLADTNGLKSLLTRDKLFPNRTQEDLAKIYRNDMFISGRWLEGDARAEKAELALATYKKTMGTFCEASDALKKALTMEGCRVPGYESSNNTAPRCMHDIVVAAIKDVFGNDVFGNDAFGNDAFGNDAFGNDAFGNDAFGNDAFGVQIMEERESKLSLSRSSGGGSDPRDRVESGGHRNQEDENSDRRSSDGSVLTSEPTAGDSGGDGKVTPTVSAAVEEQQSEPQSEQQTDLENENPSGMSQAEPESTSKEKAAGAHR